MKFGALVNAGGFNQAVNSWNVSKVSTMRSMFYRAGSFNQAVNSWDVSKVENMNQMFLLTVL